MIDPVIRDRLTDVETWIAKQWPSDGYGGRASFVNHDTAATLADLYAIRDALQREIPPPAPPAPPVDIEEVAIAVWHRMNAKRSTAVADAAADAVRRCLTLALAAPAQPGGTA